MKYQFTYKGTTYRAFTLHGDEILKRCKDLLHLSMMGGVDRSAEIDELLASIKDDLVVLGKF